MSDSTRVLRSGGILINTGEIPAAANPGNAETNTQRARFAADSAAEREHHASNGNGIAGQPAAWLGALPPNPAAAPPTSESPRRQR